MRYRAALSYQCLLSSLRRAGWTEQRLLYYGTFMILWTRKESLQPVFCPSISFIKVNFDLWLRLEAFYSKTNLYSTFIHIHIIRYILEILCPVWVIVRRDLAINGKGVKVAAVWGMLNVGHVGRLQAPVLQAHPIQRGEPHEMSQDGKVWSLWRWQSAALSDNLRSTGCYTAGKINSFHPLQYLRINLIGLTVVFLEWWRP